MTKSDPEEAMEDMFEPRQCPYCERRYTPTHKKQITCGRLKCQALRAKILRSIRDEKPLDPKVAQARAQKKAERRSESIRYEAQKIALGLAIEHLCSQPSIIDESPLM